MKVQMITKLDAIESLVGTVEGCLGDAVTVFYKDDQTPPSEAEIDAEVIRLQAKYDAQEYARNRQAEYPSIADLVVALYDTDDKSAVEAKRAAVKLKYPKPE